MIKNKNKFVLITGGSDRIGKAIAIKMAQLGYNLIIQYNTSKEKALYLKKEIEKIDKYCELIQMDFLEDNCDNLDLIFEKYNIEIVINNSPIFKKSNSYNDIILFKKIFKINLEIPYLIIKKFIQNKDNGLIINILDTKISQNKTEYFDYLLSKKFLFTLTETLSYHLAPSFRVNAISPGIILPPKEKDINYIKKLSNNIPLKKIGSLKNITESIEFLVKNDFITGQNIFVDGGEHLE